MLLFSTPSPSEDAAPEATSPDLIVVIAIDHLGTDLYSEWRPKLSGGLGRASRDGIVYPNGFHSHARTETCAGHATLISGKHPSRTGMIANVWYDADAGEEVYCTRSETLVRADDPDAPARGPDNLRATTLGDWLKASSPESRVVSVSGKDRAAITMAGHSPDAVFWYADGGFTTYLTPSGDAQAAMAPVARLNTALDKRWESNPPAWKYSVASCRARESSYDFAGTQWQSGLPPEGWRTDQGYEGIATHLAASPFMDEITLDAARALIDRFRLGRRGVTDLLAVGLVATDYIAHRFGTRGPEMCDQMHRLDRMLEAFLAELEADGLNPLVVITGDHGGIDFPERQAAQGSTRAARVEPAAWLAPINDALADRFELDAPPLTATYGGEDVTQLYLVGADGRTLAHAYRDDIIAAAVAEIESTPEVVGAWSTAELARGASGSSTGMPPDELSLEERFRRSFYAGRSGDIVVAFAPEMLPYRAIPGRFVTSHGAPWDYDRKVPVVFWTPHGSSQERPWPIHTVDIAPTLARTIGVDVPDTVDGEPLSLAPLLPAPATPDAEPGPKPD